MKKIFLIAVLALFFLLPTVSSFASKSSLSLADDSLLEHRGVRLWPASKPGDNTHRVKLFAYIPKSAEYTVYSNPSPTTISSKCPAIIIFPGGSYCYLGINVEGHDIAKFMKNNGVAAFVLRYRTGMYGNHYPDAYEDYKHTVDYIKAGVRSGKWNIDTTKIGVIGFSAGGHLAGCAALDSNPHYRPAFAGMIYPVISMNKPWSNKKSRRNLLHGAGYLCNWTTKCDEKVMNLYSLEDHVYPGMAPVFIMQCKDDKTVSIQNSTIFIEKLQEANVQDCEWHVFERGGHGFGLNPISGSDAAGWSNMFIKWLKKLWQK
ncbi:MAG: alpha/beta hydrolase [Bacteroidales bacterium]|jgi:acetyl esterase/lipase|nr:alpha/beta hydrolase [Bacteroidales bacterium]